MDALKMIKELREFGIEPTIIDVGLGRADFRLGVKIEEPLDIYYVGKCLNKYALAIRCEKNYIYFDTVVIDEKTFAEIVGG